MTRIEKLLEFMKTAEKDSFLQHALALEYIKIGNDEEGFVLMLQSHAIGKRANIVTEMESSSWPVTGEEAGFGVCHRLFPFIHISLVE